ncbi:MAG: metallophosphoesterase [Croceitalea sp.]|nr:metallophosphoesterase [Croceitalea sp.]
MSFLRLFVLCCAVLSFLKTASQNTKSPISNTAAGHTVKDSVNYLKHSKDIVFDGVDGPYIINDTLFRVNTKNRLIKVVDFENDSICVQVDNRTADQFYVRLNPTNTVTKSTYPQPEKLVVLSDIEGNYNAFASFLISNKIMDKNHNWIYGTGHLVLLGDFVDRGINVTQVLWLIYRLEKQAEDSGGQIHFILGNHEVLNFHGDYRYNQGKYIKVAQEISNLSNKADALKFLYSDRSIIGRWLATKNTIEKIGDYLFVHGGLHLEILKYQLTLDEINTKVRLGYFNAIDSEDKAMNFLYSVKGPFWYRGLVMGRRGYTKIQNDDLDSISSVYDFEKIVVGHTPVKNISMDYEGKVIRVDVPHGLKKFSGKTKGLLIQNGIEYIIDDLGSMTLLD